MKAKRKQLKQNAVGQQQQEHKKNSNNSNKSKMKTNNSNMGTREGEGEIMQVREREEEREADNLLKSCAFYGILSKCYQGSWRGKGGNSTNVWKEIERERARGKDCNLFRKLM